MTLQENIVTPPTTSSSTAAVPFDPAAWVAAMTKAGYPPYVVRDDKPSGRNYLRVCVTDYFFDPLQIDFGGKVPAASAADMPAVIFYLERHIPKKLDAESAPLFMRTMEAFGVRFRHLWNEEKHDYEYRVGSPLVFSAGRVSNLGEYLRERLSPENFEAIGVEIRARKLRQIQADQQEFYRLPFLTTQVFRKHTKVTSYWNIKRTAPVNKKHRSDMYFQGQSYALTLLDFITRTGHGAVLRDVVAGVVSASASIGYRDRASCEVARGFMEVIIDAASFGISRGAVKSIRSTVEFVRAERVKELEQLSSERSEAAKKGAAARRRRQRAKMPQRLRKAA